MYVHDLLIKGGHVLDPGSGLDGVMDVGVNGATITAVAPEIPRADAVEVVEADGLIVTPGFIDLHTHVADGITRHGVNPDRAGVLQGVTTVVDGGSVGPHTFVGLRRHVLPAARTRVISFLNLSFAGQAWMPELRSPADLDEAHLTTTLATNADVIRGIKVRCITPTLQAFGPELLDLGARFADTIDGRVMVHIGDHGEGKGTAGLTRKVIARLRPGDILTHPFTAYPGGAVDDGGAPLEEVAEAAERGVVIDVGRGARNFSIPIARRALERGFLPDTISTDLTINTIHGPVFGLADTASIFLNLGMALPDVVERVTGNPARALGLFDALGSIAPGKVADLTLLHHLRGGDHTFHGFEGERMTGDQLLVPRTTVFRGVRIECALPAGSAMAAAAATL